MTLPLLPTFLPTSATNPILEATELEGLLSYLNQLYQVDLTGYKRSTLFRRTLVRMQQIGVEDYHSYLTYLQRPEEVTHLLDTIFINYTYFFRDRPVWSYLAEQVIPQIIANKAPDEPIRVWSAGCASGEETYSLAILLIEALGIDQFQQRVQIYGTDVDLDALLQARRGQYSAHAMLSVPAAFQEQYFERKKDLYCWRQDLRSSISFQHHNLIQKPLLPPIDLLVCRNLLMYFTAETQLRALANSYLSLKEDGFLLVGQAESLVSRLQRSLFTSIHFQARVFKKVPNAHQSSPLLLEPLAS